MTQKRQRRFGRRWGGSGIACTIAVFALAFAACGGSSGASDSGEVTEEQALEYAECMRDNGVPDFPDPTVDDDGNVQIFGGGGGGQPSFDFQSQGFQDATEACRDLIPEQTFSRGDQSEFQDQLLELTECLRDQGLTVDDPDFSSGGGFGGGGGGLFGDLDQDDPKVQAALEECQGAFGGQTPFGGQG